jgi:twitching motility protein PilT
VAALEILTGNPAVINLIREGKTFQIPSIMQTARGEGMQMMDQHILELLKARRIDAGEAHRCAADKRTFESFLAK